MPAARLHYQPAPAARRQRAVPMDNQLGGRRLAGGGKQRRRQRRAAQGALVVAVARRPQHPTTVRSPGTSMPRRWATATVAAAMSSLLAKMAVGREGSDSRASAASRPEL